MILSKDKDTGYFTEVLEPIRGNLKVHDISNCLGDHPCAIHNTPSNHPLKDAPLNWREDRGILERVCPHGVGHPDYDSAQYLVSIGRDDENIHGCDGCCML